MRLAIAIVVVLVSSSCFRDSSPPTTPVQPTPTAPPPTAPPPQPTQRDLTGRWVESFDSRSGCSDTIEIVRSAGGYVASGADCNDRQPYKISDLAYDGGALSLQVLVPETGYVVHYKLRWSSTDELAGVAEVVGPSTTEPHDVRWTRQP